MTKNVLPFVKEQLPEFVRSDHPQFQTFIEAYYEFLEKTNDSDSTTVKNLFKSSANPSNIINNISEYADVDRTLNDFIRYFESSLVPFGVTNNAVTDGFILSKIRDVYLSKGTPNSFKLLFALLYGEEIDVFVTKDQILGASSGIYTDFAQMKVSVAGNASDLEDFKFELSYIYTQDSEASDLLTVIDGTYTGVDRNGFTVLTLLLSELPSETVRDTILLGNRYILRDAEDSTKFIEVEVLNHLSSITIDTKSSGHRIGDLFVVKDDINSVNVPVTKITQGTIERIFARNRGLDYRIGDTIEFLNENSGDGTGGIAFVTDVDKQGAIIEIDGIPVRTLDSDGNNRGYLSDDFQDTSVPIIQGGFYTSVPVPTIRSSTGSGAVFAGWSSSVGSIEELTIEQSGFFDSDSTLTIQSPITVDIQNPEEDIPIGSVLEFQYFAPDSDIVFFTGESDLDTRYKTVPFFASDSELLTIDITVGGNYDSETSLNTVQNDSEFNATIDSDGAFTSWGWKRRTKVGKRTIRYKEEIELTTANYSSYLSKYLGRYNTLPDRRIIDRPLTSTSITSKNIITTDRIRPTVLIDNYVRTPGRIRRRPTTKVSVPSFGNISTITSAYVRIPYDLTGLITTFEHTYDNAIKTSETKRYDSDKSTTLKVAARDPVLRTEFPTSFNLGNPLFFKVPKVADTITVTPRPSRIGSSLFASRLSRLEREIRAVKRLDRPSVYTVYNSTTTTQKETEDTRLTRILEASRLPVITTQIVIREVEVTDIVTVDSDIKSYAIELPVSWNQANFSFETKVFYWHDSERDSDFIDKYVNDSAFSFSSYTTETFKDGRRRFPITINDPSLYANEDFHWSQITGTTEYEGNFYDGEVLLPKNVNLSYSISHEEIISPVEANPTIPVLLNPHGRFISTGLGGVVSSISTDGISLTLTKSSAVSNGDSEINLPSVAQILSYDNLNNAIIRVARINPETGAVLTKDTFPVSNVITRYSAPSITASLATVSLTQKKFLDETGFISSISGSALRDNFQISEYTYILQSSLPISTWREKVKKTLHPAGLILLGELNVNSGNNLTVTSSVVVSSQSGRSEGSQLTFDLDDDFYNNTPDIGKYLFADTTYFESNAFNSINITTDTASNYITADNTTTANSVNTSQYGNAYWDYEPLGFTGKEWIVFDSEAHFNYVVNNFNGDSEFEKFKIFFHQHASAANANSNGWALNKNLDSDTFYVKVSTQLGDDSDASIQSIDTFYQRHSKIPNGRYLDDINIATSRVFIDEIYRYRTFDSDIPEHVGTRFSNVNSGFKALTYPNSSDADPIDYESIGGWLWYSTQPDGPDRRRELMMKKAKDFNKALRLNGSLTFKIGDVTYTDMDAYEMKYNTWNDLRDSDISWGWRIPGKYATLQNISRNPSDSDYNDSDILIPDTKIRNKFVIEKTNWYALKKSPRTAVAYGKWLDSDRDFTLSVFPIVTEINSTVQYIDRDSDNWDVVYPLDRKRKV